MEFVEYPDRDMLFLALAGTLTGQLGQALRSGGRASISVPGGTTPGPLFDLMSDVELDWANTAILLNDERWVPEDNSRSNTAQLKRRFLKGAAAQAVFVPLFLEGAEIEDAVPVLTAGLEPHLPLTCAVLGMGEDMHVASLFPGGDKLAEALSNAAPPLVAMRASGAEEPRITLSAPVLKAAMHIHLLILGNEKRNALERAQTLPPELAPVRAILDNATVHWAE